MGPFPHSAPLATLSPGNPAGTDGMEFIEFAHPDAAVLREVFQRMGFVLTARHHSRAVELWQQGDVTYVLNDEADSHARRFVGDHGPCAPSMGWRVVDAAAALAHAVAQGAEEYTGPGKVLDLPAVVGIGGSLIYFTDRYHARTAGAHPYAGFDWLEAPKPEGVGFYYLDHLTHNVHQGNSQRWIDFYARLFNFRQISFFDIEGYKTGFYSRALQSPCGRIRIPINEDKNDLGQIAEYLRRYRGEGIQHIAIGTEAIYDAADAIHARGIRFMPKPPASYYAASTARVAGHQEPLDRMEQHGILIDGEGVLEGGRTKILLQVFSKTVIGPIFFEFIQRKGDEGFGEGNFKALFESIERDQIDRGVLAAE